MTIASGWIAVGSQLWGDDSTYVGVDAARLPPIDTTQHGGTFAWLPTVDDNAPMRYDDGSGEGRSNDEIAAALAQVQAAATSDGLMLPTVFTSFFARPALFARLSSCTDCYFELAHRFADVDGVEGRCLRFMNDSQCCYVWLLRVRADGGHDVIAAVPDIDDDATGDTLEDVARFVDAVVVADDFETFLHRFALENALWFAQTYDAPLTDEQRRYVEGVRG